MNTHSFEPIQATLFFRQQLPPRLSVPKLVSGCRHGVLYLFSPTEVIMRVITNDYALISKKTDLSVHRYTTTRTGEHPNALTK